MDIAKSFTYMFEDTDWMRKLGIGTLVMLLGILFSVFLVGLIPLILVLGYALDVTRNVLEGRANPLPEWTDWEGFLRRGFKLGAALFIWALPAILMLAPFLLGMAISESGRDAEAVASLFYICSTCLMMLWAIFLALVTPAIYVAVARTDRFASAFDFTQLWAFTRDNIGNVIVALLLTILTGIIASAVAPLGLIALLIGVLITAPLAALWQILVQAHLYGQIGARSASVTA